MIQYYKGNKIEQLINGQVKLNGVVRLNTTVEKLIEEINRSERLQEFWKKIKKINEMS